MKYRIFSLHPDIFRSFFETSLIARAVDKSFIEYELINWREQYGLGNYKQVDDKPYGGGSGMVLQADPIYKALQDVGGVSPLFEPSKLEVVHARKEPNNLQFLDYKKSNPGHKKVTISLTPKGYPVTQQVVEWLAGDFQELNILCGRYEGFDARVSEVVDLELSIGNFVLNGGEVGAMALMESVSRLVPGFLTKETSALHDSFSSELNHYREQTEYVVGKRRLEQGVKAGPKRTKNLVFDRENYLKNILPKLEHNQYTRPAVWNGFCVPKVLLDGNHKDIQKWRSDWSVKV